MNANSCVETPAAPEWLSKLENRRENLRRGRLGHEAGAGAPCNECGDKCPGLDLHFWRKVCRNCKCRKDQHLCPDDDLSGWAQFEILGQIRSKPAFIKIKALASQPIHLEWVPPNAAPDVISDYMEKLGTAQIPVSGSDAAHKRKQQLEFQVPPHDLDPSLCDNLSQSEEKQLQQYVQKIRENCVGQGSVVRIGNLCHGVVQLLDEPICQPEYAQVMAALHEEPVVDTVLRELLSDPEVTSAILNESPSAYAKSFVVFSKPICESNAEFEAEPILSKATKHKLCGLNKEAVRSLVYNGPIYDKVIATLEHKNLNVSRDPKLGTIADFRREYHRNPQFKQEIDAVFTDSNSKAQYATPIKSRSHETQFNSPVAVKNAIQARFGTQICQETPMRKVKFGNISTIVYDCGLPTNIEYEKDPLFAQILHSEPLKKALQGAKTKHQVEPIVVSSAPLHADFMQEPTLSLATKQQLQSMGVDTKALQAALLNGPFYDCVLQKLADKDILHPECKLLTPFKHLRHELMTNRPFYEEASKFVANMPNSADVMYGNLQGHFNNSLTESKSNDSGFNSKPTTPNYATYTYDELATPDRFAAIAGQDPYGALALSEPLKQLHITQSDKGLAQPAAAVLNCRDCEQVIHFGEIAVKAERAGKEIAWHPECFKCHSCRELLADLVYFFHAGKVYCGRDLAIKLKIPRCKACDELIFTKEYTAAENATFHIKHFCCYHCDEPLAGQQYVPDEKSNMPLCLTCFEEHYAAVCQMCKRPIGPSDQGVTWNDVHWHHSCFLCAGKDCGKSLIGGRFCVKENFPFCSPICVRSILH